MDFFTKMQDLGDNSLAVRQLPDGSAQFSWQPHGGQTPWSKEWMQLLWVDDPAPQPSIAVTDSGSPQTSAKKQQQPQQQQHQQHQHQQLVQRHGLTPLSIPTALAALYIAELRIALKAIREGRWDELWRPILPEARVALPSTINLKSRQAHALHVILKDGIVVVGQLQEVRRCPSVQQDALHRRDQSSELELMPCRLAKDSATDSTTVARLVEGTPLRVQPCHWVCALPSWTTKVLPGDGLNRLSEVLKVIEGDTSAAENPLAAAVTLPKNLICMGLPPGASRPFHGKGFHPVAIPICLPVWPCALTEMPVGSGGMFLHGMGVRINQARAVSFQEYTGHHVARPSQEQPLAAQVTGCSEHVSRHSDEGSTHASDSDIDPQKAETELRKKGRQRDGTIPPAVAENQTAALSETSAPEAETAGVVVTGQESAAAMPSMREDKATAAVGMLSNLNRSSSEGWRRSRSAWGVPSLNLDAPQWCRV